MSRARLSRSGTTSRASVLALLVLSATGCGGDLTLPNGTAANLALLRGTGQTALVGDSVPDAPAVVVHDGQGNPVSGVAVNFTVTQGGGVVGDSSAATGADGVASAGSWTLGTSAGLNRLQAGLRGSPEVPVVGFTAVATADVPSGARSTIAADPVSITASRGERASTIFITVVDRYGNPLPNVIVTLASSVAGDSLRQPAATDGAGKASGGFSATAAGEHSLTAVVADRVTVAPVIVRVIAGAPVPASTVVGVPDGQAGEATRVRVHLIDEFGNAVSQNAGAIGVDLSGANAGAALSVQEIGGGDYEALYTPTIPGEDRVSLSVGGSTVPGSPFATRVGAGPADPSQTSADVPVSMSLFDTADLVVTVRDRLGNVVGHGGDRVAIAARVLGVETTLDVVDAGNGTYTARFKPEVLSPYAFAVTLGSQPIAGSPYTTRITIF